MTFDKLEKVAAEVVEVVEAASVAAEGAAEPRPRHDEKTGPGHQPEHGELN